MILRAIIDDVLDSTKVRVRIPEYNKIDKAVGATPSAELATAVCCCTPGLTTTYRRGDIVLVGFERDDLGTPVVLGALASADSNQAVTDAKLTSLTVNVDAQLPLDTYVHGAGKEFWQYLSGIHESVQTKLTEIDSKIAVLEKTDASLRFPFAEFTEF